jgi:hypothetical protein
VAQYRLYSSDRVGHLSFAEDFDADSDEEAISRARELRPNATQCEIWEYRRLVASLRPQDLAG